MKIHPIHLFFRLMMIMRDKCLLRITCCKNSSSSNALYCFYQSSWQNVKFYLYLLRIHHPYIPAARVSIADSIQSRRETSCQHQIRIAGAIRASSMMTRGSDRHRYIGQTHQRCTVCPRPRNVHRCIVTGNQSSCRN